MKQKIVLLICLCSLVVLQSCSTRKFGKGTVSANKVPRPEIVVQPALREFLKKNPTPSIVLRVPFATSSVTRTEDIDDYNSLYGRIEKELMKVGYIVRDRSMLNTVLSSGENLSYQEIGKKIQTDIILEIIAISKAPVDKQNIDIQTEFKYPSYINNADIKQDLLNNISMTKYIVDCKIVLINSGETVGMYTANYCRCNKNLNQSCPFDFQIYIRGEDGYMWRWIKGADSKWYEKINYLIDMEELSEMVANDLIKIFQGQ